jgi:hypothetical protein
VALKQLTRINILKSKSTLLAATIVNAFIFLIQAPWDPEGHHDGIMFTAALEASKGKVPNKDFFAQYGPITPFLQGLWLRLTTPTLLSLRIFSALLLTACGILIYVLVSKQCNRILGLLVSTGWALSTPRILPTDVPWSSILSTLLFLIILGILPNALQRNNKGSQYLAVLIGFLMFEAGFIRIHMWITFFCVLLAISFFQLEDAKNFRKFAIYGGSIGLVSTFAVFSVFGLSGSWFEQCIKWAFSFYAGPKQNTKVQIVNTLLPLFYLYFSALFLGYLRLTRNCRRLYRIFIPLCGFFLITIYIGRLYVPYGDRTFRNPVYMTVYQADNFHYLIDSLALCAVMYYTFKIVKYSSIRKSSSSVLGIVIAFSSLAQLYPSPDPLHLWYIAPLCLVASSPFISDSLVKLIGLDWSKKFSMAIGALVVSLFVVLVVNALNHRVIYTDKIFSSMRGVPNSPMEKTMLLLEKQAIPGSVDMQCMNGIYASAGGHYLASSKYFVNWGPKGTAIDSPNSKQRFFCYVAKPFGKIIDLEKWNLVFEVPAEYPDNYYVLFERK